MFSKYRGYILAILALILTLARLGTSTLSVYNWQALQETDQSLLNISYSIANYGFAPFGKTIIGRLVHSPNFGQECTPQKEQKEDYENTFMLIPRGQCQFATKTLNAQKLGAQMAIIMDSQEHKGSVIMADNGYGYKVSIPSIFVNAKDGEKLKKLLQENEGEDQTDVLMKITFENQKTDSVDVTFYLQANNRQSYRFVEGFRRYYHLIQSHINLNLVYYNVHCPKCPSSDCYNDNNYCAFNFVHQESASGQLILDQEVRQQLMFQLYPDQWWRYMQYIGDECGVISQYDTCHKNALKHVNVEENSFEQKFKELFRAKGQNKFLFSNREDLALAGINRYPTVTLNKIKVKGNLHAQFVFDDICNTLSDPPKECKKYVENETIFKTDVTNQWPTLVLVVALGVLIFSLIFCVYRRYMKKKISREMQGRVDDMVSKYIEFYSERNKA